MRAPPPAAPTPAAEVPDAATTDPEPARRRAAGRGRRAAADKQREAVVLHHLAGLPYAEVAAELGGIAPAAARRAAADGIAALRTPLGPRRRMPVMSDQLLDRIAAPDAATLARLHADLAATGRRRGPARRRLPHASTARSARCCWRRRRTGSCASPSRGEGHDDVLAALADGDQPAHPRRAGPPRRRRPPARRVLRRPPPRVRRRRRPAAVVRASAAPCSSTCATIPYGATESYAAVARAAGSPNAVRAAGSACATNPVPVVVPCHRVVRSDGSIGQYRGGVAAKRTLLALEAA